MIVDDDVNGVLATEILIRASSSRLGYIAISEVRLLGRELSAALSPVIFVEPPLEHHTLGGNATLRRHRFEMAAEVINLERNVLITGDHDDFDTSNVGLHVMGGYGGVMRVSYTRVEWCGQSAAPPPFGSGELGRYCLHMHHLSHCADCLIEGNAIEYGIEKGVTIHDTHDALVHGNVVWDLRGAGVYVEDGNEMNNTISENVVLCGDMPKHECKIPHAQHASGVGLYVIGMRNRYLRNRAAGFETGICERPPPPSTHAHTPICTHACSPRALALRTAD